MSSIYRATLKSGVSEYIQADGRAEARQIALRDVKIERVTDTDEILRVARDTSIQIASAATAPAAQGELPVDPT
jgi:hypothetical protein